MTDPITPSENELQLIEMTRDFGRLFDRDNPIETKVQWNGLLNVWEFVIGGFYKHGSVTVRPRPGTDGFGGKYDIEGRYGQLDTADSFDNLIRVNYYEWLSWKDRGYSLNEDWLPFILELGLVKKVETTTYEPAESFR